MDAILVMHQLKFIRYKLVKNVNIGITNMYRLCQSSLSCLAEVTCHLHVLAYVCYYAVARPSVVCLSVTLVRATQAVEIFGNVSAPFLTLE